MTLLLATVPTYQTPLTTLRSAAVSQGRPVHEGDGVAGGRMELVRGKKTEEGRQTDMYRGAKRKREPTLGVQAESFVRGPEGGPDRAVCRMIRKVSGADWLWGKDLAAGNDASSPHLSIL